MHFFSGCPQCPHTSDPPAECRGCPQASARAQLDEARHARLAFSLASDYSQAAHGPGRLAFSGALDALALRACYREATALLVVIRDILQALGTKEDRHFTAL